MNRKTTDQKVKAAGLLLSVGVLLLGMLESGCRPAGKPPLAVPVEELAEAEKLARSGRPRGAAELLEKLTRDSAGGKSGELSAKIAGYYLASGASRSALRWSEKALALAPRDPGALYVKAEACRRLREMEKADQLLQEVLRISPGHPQASLSMARLKFRVSAPADALPFFETYFSGAGRDEPEEAHATARLEYGRALRAAGEHQAAADEFARLLESEPSRSEYYSELSATLYRMRLRKEARFLEGIYRSLSQGSFEEYGVAKMRAEGREAQALAQLGVNRQRQRRYLDAFRAYQAALEANAGDARIPVLYARYCLGLRRIEEGTRVLAAALAAGCEPRASLWWEKGRLEVEGANWQAAVDAFQSVLEVSPVGGSSGGDPAAFSACLGLARSLLELGKHAPAAAAIERARQLSPMAWEPPYWEGRSLLLKGEPAASLLAFDRALRLCREGKTEPPGDLAAWRAVAIGRSGDKKAALEILLARLEKAPGLLELYPEVIEFSEGAVAKTEWATRRFAEMAANQEKIDQLEAGLSERPLEESSGLYIELARAYSIFRRPEAYESLFLASELDPSNAGALKDLLKIRKKQQEVFFRLRLLRRLLAVEPSSEAALYGIAEIFVKLHVRTKEARELVAEGLRRHPASERLKVLQEQLAARPGGG